MEATTQQKTIVQSFLKFLAESKVMDGEQFEVTESMLKAAFAIDENTAVNAVDLTQLIKAVDDDAGEFDEEKWQQFIQVLQEKGYFNGCEEGSAEHAARTEKAKTKFLNRSNPYTGLTPEQLKVKGNDLMKKGQYKPAVGFYSKAIELEPDNAIFYCNRAAAYTHLNQYNEAARDCEKSTALKPDYSKAYSRLGTAHLYLQNFPSAVEAYKKACELEPANETYKSDLAVAESKAANPMPMNPFGPGGFNMDAINSMMANPQFQQMAANMMQQPGFEGMMNKMAESMGGGKFPDMGKLAEMIGESQGNLPTVDGENIPTPYGPINKEKFQKLREANADNPKFQQLRDDLTREGPAAMARYMNDPEVMSVMNEFSSQFFSQAQASESSEEK